MFVVCIYAHMYEGGSPTNEYAQKKEDNVRENGFSPFILETGFLIDPELNFFKVGLLVNASQSLVSTAPHTSQGLGKNTDRNAFPFYGC